MVSHLYESLHLLTLNPGLVLAEFSFGAARLGYKLLKS